MLRLLFQGSGAGEASTGAGRFSALRWGAVVGCVMQWITKERFRVCSAALALFFVCAPALRAHEVAIAITSAASFAAGQPLAPNSIAAVFGAGFAEQTTVAPQGELPEEIDSVSVTIEDSAGVEHKAKLFIVTENQINILIPNLPAGTAHMQAMRGAETLADGEFEVRPVSPGLFSAASSGAGLAAAVAVRANADGSQSYENVAVYNAERGAWEPMPINLAAGQVHLSLFGTGVRGGSELAAAIDGVPVDVDYHGAHAQFPGLDQVNIGPLPLVLSGRPVVDIVLTVDGIDANKVQVAFSLGGVGGAVTFNNQIVRLFQAHCQACHRPGQVAPFSLLDYESAEPWAQAIKLSTQERRMPPWKPVPGHGEFIGERRLDDNEIALIARWVDDGAPEGDPADLPAPLVFNDDWVLGEPDMILDVPEYTPDLNGADDYRCFSVPVPTDETRSIAKVEVLPGNRKIVHHVILFGDPTGQSAALEAAETGERPGYTCFGGPGFEADGAITGVESYIQGGWVPGYSPQVLPAGSGYFLRPNARMAVQIHYFPDGTQQTDRTRIGLHFAEEQTAENVLVLPVINSDFIIPAGANNHEVTAEFPDAATRALFSALNAGLGGSLFPVEVVSVLPHMHLLGKEIRMDRISADGAETPMIYIDDWDFNWQDFYTYKEPVLLELTDTLRVRARYDNSASNPRNPNNPPQPVGWGDRTTDEMCLVFFLVKIPDLCRLPLGFCAGL